MSYVALQSAGDEGFPPLKTKYDPTNLFRHNQNIKPLHAVAELA